MNVDKAIEIKALTGEEFLNADPDEIDEADRLSIEALKRLGEQRRRFINAFTGPLPGETEQ